MKRICAIISGVLLMFAIAAAQQAAPRTGQDVPKYDPAKQEAITGTIEVIHDYQCPVSGSLGTHITLKAFSGGTFEAHLAPAAFLKEFGVKFNQSDTVTLTGTKVMFDGKPAILVRTAKVRNETFMFRDDKGRPLW